MTGTVQSSVDQSDWDLVDRLTLLVVHGVEGLGCMHQACPSLKGPQETRRLAGCQCVRSSRQPAARRRPSTQSLLVLEIMTDGLQQL